jgi:hypothetical protein
LEKKRPVGENAKIIAYTKNILLRPVEFMCCMNYKMWTLFIASPHEHMHLHSAASFEREAMSAVENITYPQSLWH